MPFHQTLFDRISEGGNRLFGAPQGLLSPEEQQFAQQQGLLGLGSSLLRASGPSRDPVGLGQAIGEAIPQGQAAAFQGLQTQDFLQQRQAEQEQEAQRQKFLQRFAGQGETGLVQLQEMFRDAVALGRTDEARSVAAVLQSIISRQGRGGTGPQPRLQAGQGPEGQPGFFEIEGGEATRVRGIRPIPPRPRASEKPRDLRTDPRTTRMFSRFIELKGQMLKPIAVDLNTPNLQERVDSGEFVETDRGVFTKPLDLAVANQRAMRQAREEFNPLFNAEEQDEIDRITEGLVREVEKKPEVETETFSAAEITEAKRLIQGLGSRKEKENELAAVGYTPDQIKRILNGR